MSDLLSPALRDFVRLRAGRVCEYCRLHEEDCRLSHEPDHVIARKHRGETTLDNLAWTCFACNRHKGTDIASIDRKTGKIVRLFNPRQDTWKMHFRLLAGRIVPRTPQGRVTEFLLHFNHPMRIRIRLDLIRARRYPRE